jgi:hypothetical protein
MFQLPIEAIIRPNIWSYTWSHDGFDRNLKCLAPLSFDRKQKFSVICILNFILKDDSNHDKRNRDFNVPTDVP